MIPIKEFIDSNSSTVLLRTDFKINLEEVLDFFNSEVVNLKKQYQGKKRHGGWSIQSNTGEISDGWQTGGTPGLTDEDIKRMFPLGTKFTQPTSLYRGPMKELIENLNAKQFQASRTRLADLEPTGTCGWHRDGKQESKIYGWWRGHIVLKTNPDALFQFRSQDEKTVLSYNIPADGYLYLANVNQPHRVENFGKESRIHILTDSLLPMSIFQVNAEPILSF